MVAAEITLKFLWEFLNPVFGEKLKDSLKKKDSAEIAKRRVLRLYKSLGDLKARSFDFISAVRLYASLIEERASSERLHEIKDYLYDRTNELMAATAEMVDALDELSPQLEIHNYALYQTITYFKGGRDAYGITDAWSGIDFEAALTNAEEGNPDELNRILAQEEQSYQSIDGCLADFRIFMVKEIPFNQSF
jgi:hypothetical protein